MSEQTWPQLDDRVHVWIDGQGCHPGTVDQRILDAPTGGNVVALSIKTDRRIADCSHRISRDYDPEMEVSGAWHWPHDHEPPKAPSLNIEALARLGLRPDEILAVTYGAPGLTVDQCEQVGEYLTGWLADHGQPVAGVLVLPQGSGLAAVRAPEPVTHEQVMRGEKSINDYRRYLGMQPIPDSTPDEAPDHETQAFVGCLVHIHHANQDRCVLGVVEKVHGDVLVIDGSENEPKFGKHMTDIHDETRQIDGSWHWLHDNGQPAEPEPPEAPAPITINVHVEGSVLSEKKLQDVIASQLSRAAAMRGLRW